MPTIAPPLVPLSPLPLPRGPQRAAIPAPAPTAAVATAAAAAPFASAIATAGLGAAGVGTEGDAAAAAAQHAQRGGAAPAPAGGSARAGGGRKRRTRDGGESSDEDWQPDPSSPRGSSLGRFDEAGSLPGQARLAGRLTLKGAKRLVPRQRLSGQRLGQQGVQAGAAGGAAAAGVAEGGAAAAPPEAAAAAAEVLATAAAVAEAAVAASGEQPPEVGEDPPPADPQQSGLQELFTYMLVSELKHSATCRAKLWRVDSASTNPNHQPDVQPNPPKPNPPNQPQQPQPRPIIDSHRKSIRLSRERFIDPAYPAGAPPLPLHAAIWLRLDGRLHNCSAHNPALGDVKSEVDPRTGKPCGKLSGAMTRLLGGLAWRAVLLGYSRAVRAADGREGLLLIAERRDGLEAAAAAAAEAQMKKQQAKRERGASGGVGGGPTAKRPRREGGGMERRLSLGKRADHVPCRITGPSFVYVEVRVGSGFFCLSTLGMRPTCSESSAYSAHQPQPWTKLDC
jgi:hypothetical protein